MKRVIDYRRNVREAAGPSREKRPVKLHRSRKAKTLESKVRNKKCLKDWEEGLPHSGLMLMSSRGEEVSLENLFYGSQAFLVLSGPSSRKLDLGLLNQRGCFVSTVNNAWTLVRPQIGFMVDGPRKFHNVGWQDPAIMKLMAKDKLVRAWRGKHNLREQAGDSIIERTNLFPHMMPNVWGWPGNRRFNHTKYLTENTVNWGHVNGDRDTAGAKGGRSIMLASIRLLYYLGFRTIYLVGCDFSMVEGRKNYSFEQSTGKATVKGNNNTYESLQKRFEILRPLFEENGLEVLNCNVKSGLTAFDFIDFNDAVGRATKDFPSDLLTDGWYRAPDPNERRIS